MEDGQAFSNSIFEEMHIDDLKKEYQKTKLEKQRYIEEISRGKVDKSKVNYIVEAFESKLNDIRSLIDKWVKKANI